MNHPAYGELRQVTPTASVLLANNPGKMTLDGTNTWILRAPDATECVVVDPGPPRHKDHVAKIAAEKCLSDLLDLVLLCLDDFAFYDFVDRTWLGFVRFDPQRLSRNVEGLLIDFCHMELLSKNMRRGSHADPLLTIVHENIAISP